MSFDVISQAAKAIIEASYLYDRADKNGRKKLDDYILKLSKIIEKNAKKELES